MLTLSRVEKSYQTPQGPLPVLRGVDLELGAGDSLALMGDSGSGKSTLLHLVAGLDAFDAGEIQVGDVTLSGASDRARAALRRDTVGLVFQQFNLIPSLTVGDNLAFQARLGGRLDEEWLERLTARLGLADLRNRYPEQLSGGQQQRVALGRTLAARPALILADEPTGNLDASTSDTVLQLALELVADAGSAFLMATHSARVAAMCARQGRLSDGRLEGEA